MQAVRNQVPRIRQESAKSAVITRWGHVGGFVFRAGDTLVLAEPEAERLLLLVPRGWGNPMLGRQSGRGLVAEPGGVPASTARWQVAGRIDSVERDLERAVVGGGTWEVAVRIEAAPGVRVAEVERAILAFRGGTLTGAELDALCLRAALGYDDYGVQVAIGAATNGARARQLAAAATPGRLRMQVELPEEPAEDAGRVIEGPWARMAQARQAAASPDATPSDAAAAEARADGVQLSLFSDSSRRHGT